LLPWLYIVDIEDGNCGYRFRLLGAGAASCMGGDYLGCCVREVGHRAVRDLILACCAEASHTRLPVRRDGKLKHADGRKGLCDCLVLPLANDGRKVDHVLGTMTFVPDLELNGSKST